MVKLDGVQRFTAQLSRVFGIKGQGMATVGGEVMHPTVQVNDPLDPPARLTRGEKLWGFGFSQSISVGGAGILFTVGVPNANYLTVITACRMAITTPSPPAAAVLTASAGAPFGNVVSNLPPVFYTDGRIRPGSSGAGAQTTIQEVAETVGFLCAPLVFEECLGTTASLTTTGWTSVDFAPCLPMVCPPNRSAQFAVAWNVVTTVLSLVTITLGGYERFADPNELLADGNVL